MKPPSLLVGLLPLVLCWAGVLVGGQPTAFELASSPVTVPTNGYPRSGWHQSMAVLSDGFPAIVFRTEDDGPTGLERGMWITIANKPDPVTAEDWNAAYDIQKGNHPGFDTDFIILPSGLPVVASFDGSGDLRFSIGNIAHPTQKTDWTTFLLVTNGPSGGGDVGRSPELVVLDSGNVGIFYRNVAGVSPSSPVLFSSATVAAPTSASDFNVNIVAAGNGNGMLDALAVSTGTTTCGGGSSTDHPFTGNV